MFETACNGHRHIRIHWLTFKNDAQIPLAQIPDLAGLGWGLSLVYFSKCLKWSQHLATLPGFIRTSLKNNI